jgi:hypothetical protein
MRRKRKRVSQDTDSKNEGVEEKEQMEEEIPYIK